MKALEIVAYHKRKREEESLPIRIHHTLMREYGWIPMEEFKKLPIPTVLNLIDIIAEEHEQMQRELEKTKRRGR